MTISPDEVSQEIRRSFSGVCLDSGVSWSAAESLESGVQAFADQTPRGTTWEHLLTIDWDYASTLGGFAFLDDYGFRYYIPAAMMRSLGYGVSRYDEFLAYYLTIPGDHRELITVDNDDEVRMNKLATWAILDRDQNRAVSRFLLCKHQLSSRRGGDIQSIWLRALDGHWRQFLWL